MNVSIGQEKSLSLRQGTGTYHILAMLVDDQAIAAEAIRRMLRGEDDIDFHYCMNAAKAVPTAAALKPSVILQDLIMPDVDGLALVRYYRLHPITKYTPIIVLSSKEDARIKADAFAAGANDYLVKFPDKPELLARIRYHAQWYINLCQRDDAYRALQESQRQLEELNLKLLKLSNQDGLTSIANRRQFNEFTQVEWQKLRYDEGVFFAIILFDIDNFKKYNDSLGHLAGDDCLKKVAQTIAACLSSDDNILTARYGGEEFVVAAPCMSKEKAHHLAEVMRVAVSDLAIPHPDSDVAEYVTVSVGVGCAIPSKEKLDVHVDKPIHQADVCLYQAKQSGKNKVVCN